MRTLDPQPGGNSTRSVARHDPPVRAAAPANRTGEWLAQLARSVDRAGGGLCVDIGLYAASALFAWLTAAASTLAPHRAWGAVATVGYAIATLAASGQLLSLRFAARVRWIGGTSARAAVAVGTWAAVALVPLILQAIGRASGRADRAQEEVIVIEAGGRRLLESGTPYLDRTGLAGLSVGEQLDAYMPYQPGMALFGLPRAAGDGAAWWSDARVWFALVTAVALAAALVRLRRCGLSPPALVRGLEVATVLPVCALTLATGGDDLPVLALCLLALALAASHRLAGAGLAVGAAASLKLFAWPVAVVLGGYALVRTRSGRAGPRTTQAGWFAAGAFGLPVVVAAPALVLDPGAAVENVIAFPLGHGLVASPAASPLPGHLIATYLPAGRFVVLGLLCATALAIAVWFVRRPPRTAAATSFICGVGLLGAMLLLPATRFGYLLYPVAFLVWASVLRPTAHTAASG